MLNLVVHRLEHLKGWLFQQFRGQVIQQTLESQTGLGILNLVFLYRHGDNPDTFNHFVPAPGLKLLSFLLAQPLFGQQPGLAPDINQ